MRIECGIDVNTSGQVRSGQIPQNQIAVPSFMSAENTLLRCGDGQRTRIMFYTRSKKKTYILSWETIHDDGSEHWRYKQGGTGFA